MDDKFDSMPLLTRHAMGFAASDNFTNPENDDEIPRLEPEPTQVDPFINEIAKLRHSQSPAVREAMEQATCFGRNWYMESAPVFGIESEESGICTEIECDLRSLCELTYTRATGKHIEQRNDSAVKAGVGRPKRKKAKSVRAYKRFPYVDQGRPVDKFAAELWRLLGGPPSLPDVWVYPPTRTIQAREVAIKSFVTRFGSGVMVNKRHNYHVYFKDGKHFVRLWMSHSNSGWLDTGVLVAKAIIRLVPSMQLEDVPSGGISKSHKARYYFFPYRVFLRRRPQLDQLGKVFHYLNIEPLPELESNPVSK